MGTRATGTSSTLGLTGVTAPAGALIYVVTMEAATSTGSLADTPGNTYVNIQNKSPNNLTANGVLSAWYVKNCLALSSGTITYTRTTSGSAAVISAMYATGVDTTSPLDTAVTVSPTGSSSIPTGTSGTPSVAGDLMVAVIGISNSVTISQDTTHNWVAPPDNDGINGARIYGGSQVNAGTGTIIYNPALTGTAPWVIIIAAFKAAKKFFRQTPMTGTGIGGPFFSNPLEGP